MNVSNNINNLQAALRDIGRWEQNPTPPSSSAEDIEVLTRLGTSILNLSKVPLSEVPLAQRVQIREIIQGMQGAFSPGTLQRMMSAFRAITDPGLGDLIQHTGENGGALVAGIDRWSVDHFREDEPQWAALSPDELASHRETYLIFARGYLKDALIHPDTLRRLIREPERRASWTVRLRALIEKFPELRTELPLTMELLREDLDTYDLATAKEFIILGAPLSDPRLLACAAQANDFELLDTLIQRYELESNPRLLHEAWEHFGVGDLFDYTVVSVESLPEADAVKILNRLVQACKDNRLPPSNNTILFTLCRKVKDGKELYASVVLDLLPIIAPGQLSLISSLHSQIAAFYAKAITACLPSSPHPDVPRALRLCQELDKFVQLVPNNHQEIVDTVGPARNALCNELLSSLEDPQRCGPLLDALGDAMPLLFELDPKFGESLERDGTPLIQWLKDNDWWRGHDPNWLAAEIAKEDPNHYTRLHQAGAQKAFDLLLSMPINVLRAGMSRMTVDQGWTPFHYLIHYLIVDREQNSDAVDRILERLGPARDSILNRGDTQGNTILHLLPYNLDGSTIVSRLAKYPTQFQRMMFTKNLQGSTPLQVATQIPGDERLRTVTAMLKGLNIPVQEREDVIRIVTQDEGPMRLWLQQQMRTFPPSVRLLMLPALRGEPLELGLVLFGEAELCARWLADEATIRELLSLPQEIWQQVLAIRDQNGLTPLEHLAARGDVLFWNMLREHDDELPLALLRQPDKYGTPLHHAAAAGQIDFLRAVILRHHADDGDIQAELLGLRNQHKQTPLRCAESARQETAMVFLLREVQFPLLMREVQHISRALGRQTPVVSAGSLPELRNACVQLRLNALRLQSDYYAQLPEQEKAPGQTHSMHLLLPSLKRIEKGTLVPDYFGQEGMSTAMREAPPIDFAEVLLPLLNQIPQDQPPVRDLDPDAGGERPFSLIKEQLVTFIENLAAGQPINDAYQIPLSPEFRAQIASVLRHVALYVAKAQEEICNAAPGRDQELQHALFAMVRQELIGDFGIGLFHCLDGVAMHTRQLYDFVTASQAPSNLRDQLLGALHTYRKTNFELFVSQVGGLHEATTQRYYRGLLGQQVGLGGEMKTLSDEYAPFAVRGCENEIMQKFDREHTPAKLVDYVCGLLNDPKDKTLNKALVLDWFRERFSTEDARLQQNQIMDDAGKWRPAAVGVFLTAMGVIKPKPKLINEKRILKLTLEHGDVKELRSVLDSYSVPLPDGLVQAAVQRGDPDILREVLQQHRKRGTLATALRRRNRHSVINDAVRQGHFAMAAIIFAEEGVSPPLELANGSLLNAARDAMTPEIIKFIRTACDTYDSTGALWRGQLRHDPQQLFDDIISAQKWDVVELLQREPAVKDDINIARSPLLHTIWWRSKREISQRLLKNMSLEAICAVAINLGSQDVDWIRTQLQTDALAHLGDDRVARFDAAVA